MEKTVKFTWSEIIKWVTFLALIISLFVANQIDISYLKSENKKKTEEIKALEKKDAELGEAVAKMNGKLDIINDNVDTIKDAIIGSVFVSNAVRKNN